MASNNSMSKINVALGGIHTARSRRAISKIGRDRELSRSPNGREGDTFIPSTYNLATSKIEGKRFSTIS